VPWSARQGVLGFAAQREAMLDRLADAIDEHLDTATIMALIDG
jgi:adenosylcobyric acid synthase